VGSLLLSPSDDTTGASREKEKQRERATVYEARYSCGEETCSATAVAVAVAAAAATTTAAATAATAAAAAAVAASGPRVLRICARVRANTVFDPRACA